MNKITIKVKHYLEGVYMFIGVILGMVGFMFILYNPTISVVFIFFALLSFTTVYKIAVDTQKKTYRDYLWILGLKKGNKHSFNNIDKLFFTKHQYSQKMHIKGTSSTIKYDLYSAYIQFDGDNKVLIGESKHQSKIERKLAELKKKLKVEVEDLTNGE